MSKFNWAQGQPSVNSNCAVLDTLTSKWFGVPCNKSYQFVCVKSSKGPGISTEGMKSLS